MRYSGGSGFVAGIEAVVTTGWNGGLGDEFATPPQPLNAKQIPPTKADVTHRIMDHLDLARTFYTRLSNADHA